MSGATAVAGAVQIVGGIALAPLLPGLVQHWKARLQGRRGPSSVAALPRAAAAVGQEHRYA